MPIIKGMNFRSGFFGLIMLIALLSPKLYAQERFHVVESRDTIFSIARTYSVDQNELMRVNGITDPTRLRVGQRLTIPQAANAQVTIPQGTAPSANSGDVQYRVVRGDTLYGIARTYSINVNELLAANNLSSNYILREGDTLRIPGTAPTVAIVQVPSARADTRAVESAALDASIRWPITARELSYMVGNSNGVIITGDRSESVKSLTSGTVISAGPYRGYGRVAIVQAPGGYIYVYGGCETLAVREGDKVIAGTEMGRLGIDPITEKPQLFFRVYLNNTPVDPAKAPRA